MEAADAETCTSPDHVTVEISSDAPATEEAKTSPASESTPAGLSIPEIAATNIVVLAAAVQNSNQPQIHQPPRKSSSNTATPKGSSRPPTPKPPTPTSILRKRFSVSTSGVVSSYPYPVGSPDPDDDISQSSNNSSACLTFWRVFNLMELAISAVFLGLLIASLTVDSWKHHKIWDLHLWKWCVLLFVFLGGRLAAEWLTGALVFLMQGVIVFYVNFRNEDISIWTFTPKEKFIHITCRLKTSFQLLIWAASVLLAWGLILDLRDQNRSEDTKRVLNHVTRALAGCLVGAGIWWVKAWIMELAAYDFIVERSKQRIIQSIFDQEALKNLWDNSKSIEQDGKKILEKEGKIEKITDDFRLKEKVWSYTPSKLIDIITMTELPVIVDNEQINKSPERVARATADELFARLAKNYDAKYVNTDTVLASLTEEEYKKRIPVGVEEGGLGLISGSHFKEWAIKIQLERLLLLRTLNGRDNVVGDCNRIVTVIVLIIIVVAWLLVMGFLTTQVMLLIATQILALNFVFSNTARTIFESVIFVFVTRPFDVGDLCSIDKDEQVVVNDMNMLSTVFKKSNGERLVYPNAVLMTKSITNYYGMPETNDSVEFTIAARTEPDRIKEFEDRIREYLKSKPNYWRPNDYTIEVEEIDQKDKRVRIYVYHVVNFYNGGDRKKHRKELLDKVKEIIGELKIECRCEPQ